MKNNLSFQKQIASRFYSALILLLISVFFLTGNKARSQDKETNASKMSASMSVSCKTSDGVKHVKVTVTRKENKKRIPVDNLKSPIALYLNEVKSKDPSNGTGLITNLFLNDEGEVVFDLPADFNSITSGMHECKFIARMESDPLYEDAEEEITIADAKISIEYSGKDSIKTAAATLTEWKDSAYVPAAGVEMKLSIKRAFSLFPFGEEGLTTDEDGKVSGDLPLDLPGEAGGKITIVASVVDNETYGSVESTKQVDWSVLPKVNEEMGRTLWSSGRNAPIPLVVASCLIIAVILGTLIYLVFQLFKIKKIGKEHAS
ncbi:MAG: hypothetical protein HY840_13250 [Bacteroidetes bacterium]|nr:hypothetical protein [Bacteroidota bacterium]